MIKRKGQLSFVLAASLSAIGGVYTLNAQQQTLNSPTTVIASAQTTAGQSAVELTWDAGAGASTYTIYRYEVDQQNFVDITSLPTGVQIKHGITTQSYTDSSGTPGTIYLYVVVSVDASGDESTKQGASNYSCGRAPSDNLTYPAVRPLVYMAAHGANGVSFLTPGVNNATTGQFIADPDSAQVQQSSTVTAANPSGVNPLVNTPHQAAAQADPTSWSTARTCLDGIWGNYAGFSMSIPDEVNLYDMVNTKNTIGVQDISSSTTSLVSTTSYELDPPGVNLNRRAMAIYTGDPSYLGATNVNGDGFDTTYPALMAQFTAAGVDKPYERIYTGFNINAWVHPNQTTSGNGAEGVYKFHAADQVFDDAQGNLQECDSNKADVNVCDDKNGGEYAYQTGFLNSLIATHVNGGNFVLFFAIGGPAKEDGSVGYATNGALTELQTLFNFVSTQPCSGNYDSPSGTPNTYNFCDGNNDAGLWRRGDIVMVINYQGWYPSTPEYSGPTTFKGHHHRITELADYPLRYAA